MVTCRPGRKIAMRRLFIVSALWLGLFGAVQPLLACAMNSPVSECCPTSLQTLCEHDSSGAASPVELQSCCVSAPLAEPAAVTFKQSDLKSDYAAASSNGGVAVAPPRTLSLAPTRAVISRRALTDRPDARGAETYLRTGRLRL